MYAPIVHLCTQKELGHCDLLSEIYDFFFETFFQAMIYLFEFYMH